MESLAAGIIAKLVFDEFVKAGTGEAAKRSVGGAIELVKNLRGKIKAKFQGDAKAEKAIQAIETDGSQPALAKLETYLEDAMDEDKTFATEIRQMAQQIINIQNQNTTTLNQQNLNYGRDQNIINQPQGDIRIGGS
ncbi:MAG: hypothetical protein HC827_09790 [Cyanobacteria bacterium RM1_2_2]|nr:hypothetical protein [Cyanobacteria bacterium RM1_2_2]